MGRGLTSNRYLERLDREIGYKVDYYCDVDTKKIPQTPQIMGRLEEQLSCCELMDIGNILV